MQGFNITPAQFGRMTAAYSFSAAVVGFLAGFVMDRIPRRAALLTLYAGMGLFTYACALAPSYSCLVFARMMTGLCGGVAASVVSAIVADAVSPEKRGRAMAVVGAAFPLAQVLGMPLGLWLAERFGWHAPFFLLGTICTAVFAVALFVMPPVESVMATVPPFTQMRAILAHPVHHRAFALSGMLLFAGALLAPFMPMYMEGNCGLAKDEVSLMYFCGGVVVFFSTNLFGRLSDRFDKFRVLCAITVFTIASVFVITRWENSPLWLTLILTTLFFVTMSGRFAPAMSMVANSIEAQYRGGFMSVNAAGQQACASLAHLIAGALITRDAAGRLSGYGNVGIVAAACFLLTLVLARRLRAIAPWAARNKIGNSVDASV